MNKYALFDSPQQSTATAEIDQAINRAAVILRPVIRKWSKLGASDTESAELITNAIYSKIR